MFDSHDSASPDPLVRPTFPVRHRVRRFLWAVVCRILFRPSPVPFHAWRCWLLRSFGATIGNQNFIYPTARIWAPWLLQTEDVVTIGPDVEVYNPGGVFLEHHAIVSQGAYLCGATHDYHSPDFTYVAKPIRCRAYSWVAARAIVLPGVELAEGSVVGAGAVVSRNTEPWTVYAGNPALRVGERRRGAGTGGDG